MFEDYHGEDNQVNEGNQDEVNGNGGDPYYDRSEEQAPADRHPTDNDVVYDE